MKTDLKFHPIVNLFPPMTADEFGALLADVDRHGIREPIRTHRGEIVDGRSRYLAWKALAARGKSIPLPTEEWDGEGSLTEYVYSLNIQRRHLTTAQRTACAVEARDWLIEETKPGGPLRVGTTAESIGRLTDLGSGQPATKGDGSTDATTDDEATGEKTRDVAGKMFGVGGRTVQRGIKVRKADPKLFEKLKLGEITVHQAERAVRRNERREAVASAAAGQKSVKPSDLWRVDAGNVLELAPELPDGCAALVFVDPPYNMGVDYGRGGDADLLTASEYRELIMSTFEESYRLTSDVGTFCAMINEAYVDYFGLWLREVGFHRRRIILWDERFGVNQAENFPADVRFLFYCVKNPKRYIFNFDAFKVESMRKSFYGDRRAAEDGKIASNIWSVPRLNDVSDERIPGFPTQLPVALLRPLVEGFTLPGGLVVDMMSGSGSMGEACLRATPAPRRFRGFELSAQYAETSRGRLAKVEMGIKSNTH